MLQSATSVRELEGIQTDVLLQAFADRIVVLVTQLGKVGSLVRSYPRARMHTVATLRYRSDSGHHPLDHATPAATAP